MAERTCIVTRAVSDPDQLIRFVAGPDMAVVPDLKRNLPGRGCWVTATRDHVDSAVRKKLFRKGLRSEVKTDGDLGELVDRLLAKSALGAISMARKAGQFVTGSAKCDTAIRTGEAVAVLHAMEAAPDGVRKLDQARRAVEFMDGPVIPAFKLFPEAELGLAIGGANVIHAAVLDGKAGRAAVKRIVALQEYREGPGNETDAARAAKDDI